MTSTEPAQYRISHKFFNTEISKYYQKNIFFKLKKSILFYLEPSKLKSIASKFLSDTLPNKFMSKWKVLAKAKWKFHYVDVFRNTDYCLNLEENEGSDRMIYYLTQLSFGNLGKN